MGVRGGCSSNVAVTAALQGAQFAEDGVEIDILRICNSHKKREISTRAIDGDQIRLTGVESKSDAHAVHATLLQTIAEGQTKRDGDRTITIAGR